MIAGAADIAMGDAIGGASLAVGVGTLAKSADATKDFLRVQVIRKSVESDGPWRLPCLSGEREGIQEAGAVKKIIGGDGAAREVLSIPGGYKGREGTFDFIKESDGFINHRKFEPSR